MDMQTCPWCAPCADALERSGARDRGLVYSFAVSLVQMRLNYLKAFGGMTSYIPRSGHVVERRPANEGPDLMMNEVPNLSTNFLASPASKTSCSGRVWTTLGGEKDRRTEALWVEQTASFHCPNSARCIPNIGLT